jgi:hypothetical protein
MIGWKKPFNQPAKLAARVLARFAGWLDITLNRECYAEDANAPQIRIELERRSQLKLIYN